MAAIFISYCRESQEKARSLAQDVEALGHQAWFDQELTGGQAWWNLILTEIQKCDIFAFALDPESLNSPACKREYTYAFNLRKSILPVLVADGVSIDLLPSALAQIQYLDYRREDKEAFRALAKALTALPHSPPMPDPLPEPPPAPISYLGGLREQVEAPGALSFEEQTGLVLRLKHGLREAKDAEDVRTLLRLFRSRDDLYARVADEIDTFLVGVPVPPKPSDIKSTTPKSEMHRNTAEPHPAGKLPDYVARTESNEYEPPVQPKSKKEIGFFRKAIPLALLILWLLALVAGLRGALIYLFPLIALVLFIINILSQRSRT